MLVAGQGCDGDAALRAGANPEERGVDVAGSCARGGRRPRGRLTPAARTRLRNVSGLIPRSAATDLIVASGRDSYNATAFALNCGG